MHNSPIAGSTVTLYTPGAGAPAKLAQGTPSLRPGRLDQRGVLMEIKHRIRMVRGVSFWAFIFFVGARIDGRASA